MYAVVKNVFGYFAIEESGVSKDEAIEICSRIIGESYGGEAYVVTAETASKIEGKSCTEAKFIAFGIDGHPFLAK